MPFLFLDRGLNMDDYLSIKEFAVVVAIFATVAALAITIFSRRNDDRYQNEDGDDAGNEG